jgi:hypothetical protein
MLVRTRDQPGGAIFHGKRIHAKQCIDRKWSARHEMLVLQISMILRLGVRELWFQHNRILPAQNEVVTEQPLRQTQEIRVAQQTQEYIVVGEHGPDGSRLTNLLHHRRPAALGFLLRNDSIDCRSDRADLVGVEPTVDDGIPEDPTFLRMSVKGIPGGWRCLLDSISGDGWGVGHWSVAFMRLLLRCPQVSRQARSSQNIPQDRSLAPGSRRVDFYRIHESCLEFAVGDANTAPQ